MDVQKTMNFILEQQAGIVALQAKTDRKIDAIAKLARFGMKMLVKMEEAQGKIQEVQKEGDYKLNTLIDAQQRTDEKLKALIEAQKRTDERLARTDERLALTDERLARTDEKFERLLRALLRQRANGRE